MTAPRHQLLRDFQAAWPYERIRSLPFGFTILKLILIAGIAAVQIR